MLGVSHAGFYEAKRKLDQPEICKDSVQLKALFAANQQCYGSRRMVDAMRAKGVSIGRYRVHKLMRSELNPSMETQICACDQ